MRGWGKGATMVKLFPKVVAKPLNMDDINSTVDRSKIIKQNECE
jgi:hypothetical protein